MQASIIVFPEVLALRIFTFYIYNQMFSLQVKSLSFDQSGTYLAVAGSEVQ